MAQSWTEIGGIGRKNAGFKHGNTKNMKMPGKLPHSSDRLLFLIRYDYRCQQVMGIQGSQLMGISPIRFDAIPRTLRNGTRGDHLTPETVGLQCALQPKAARGSLVATRQLAITPLQLLQVFEYLGQIVQQLPLAHPVLRSRAQNAIVRWCTSMPMCTSDTCENFF